MYDDCIALLKRYHRPSEDAPSDARVVPTRFLAFPAPLEDPEDPEKQAERVGASRR